MTTALLRSALLVALLCATSCSTASPPPESPTTPPANSDPTVEPLAAYERFWAVTDSALAAPGSRDWLPDLEAVATGPALDSLATDVENYASLPAHTEGQVTRDPVVQEVLGSRALVLDCVDLGDSRLVSDTTGDVLDDLANRVPRYQFRAELVSINGRWLVERTVPALDEPC